MAAGRAAIRARCGYARAFGAAESAPLPKEAADAYAAIMPVKAPAGRRRCSGSRWSVWGQGYGGYNRTDGSVTAGTARHHGAQLRICRRRGLSHHPEHHDRLCAGRRRVELRPRRTGSARGKSDVFQAGVYGSHSSRRSVCVRRRWPTPGTTCCTDRTVTVRGHRHTARAASMSHSFTFAAIGRRYARGVMDCALDCSARNAARPRPTIFKLLAESVLSGRVKRLMLIRMVESLSAQPKLVEICTGSGDPAMTVRSTCVTSGGAYQW